jgi:hypothetical protein
MVYFVKRFSALLKILNATAVNIRRQGIKELFAINVVLKWLIPVCAGNVQGI